MEKQKLNELKKSYHKGEVFTPFNTLNFSLSTYSNPITTAKILIAFACVENEYIIQKKYGAYSILEINFQKLI